MKMCKVILSEWSLVTPTALILLNRFRVTLLLTLFNSCRYCLLRTGEWLSYYWPRTLSKRRQKGLVENNNNWLGDSEALVQDEYGKVAGGAQTRLKKVEKRWQEVDAATTTPARDPQLPLIPVASRFGSLTTTTLAHCCAIFLGNLGIQI